MYDQIKINGIKIKLSMKGLSENSSGFAPQGIFTYIAFDRNGICHPTSGMTYEKIATYSSAKGKMLNPGSTLS